MTGLYAGIAMVATVVIIIVGAIIASIGLLNTIGVLAFSIAMAAMLFFGINLIVGGL